jgi:hypothetical protein
MSWIDYWPVITGALAASLGYGELRYKVNRAADKDVIAKQMEAIEGRFNRLEKGVDKLDTRQEYLIDYLLRKNGDKR